MGKYEDHRMFVINDPNAPRLAPSVAMEIGLNESIVFLQLEYWCSISEHVIDGRRWVYESITDLNEMFPFWSRATINRALQVLIERGLVDIGDFNKAKYDRTRWFAINIDGCAKLSSIRFVGHETRSAQNDTGSNQNDTGSAQNDTTIPKTSSKTSTKNNNTARTKSVRAKVNSPRLPLQDPVVVPSVPLASFSEAVPVPTPSPAQAVPTPTPPAVPVPQAPVAPKASVLDMPMPMKARPDSECLAARYFEFFENGIIPNNGRFRQVQGLLAGLIGNGKGGRAKSAMQFKSYTVVEVVACMEAMKAYDVQLTSPNAIGLCIDDFLADDKPWPPDWLKPARQRKSRKEREYLEWSKRKTAEAMAEDAAERAAGWGSQQKRRLEGVAA